MGYDPFNRVANDIDELHISVVLMNIIPYVPAETWIFGVISRSFTVEFCGFCEMGVILVKAVPPVMMVAKELGFLRLAETYVGMQCQHVSQ